jgi:hypothetical protein
MHQDTIPAGRLGRFGALRKLQEVPVPQRFGALGALPGGVPSRQTNPGSSRHEPTPAKSLLLILFISETSKRPKRPKRPKCPKRR